MGNVVNAFIREHANTKYPSLRELGFTKKLESRGSESVMVELKYV